LDALQAVSDSSLPSVVVEQIRSEPRNKSHILRGKTASQQTASISTEISGRVTSRPVARGARVAEGQILCEIATDDKAALGRGGASSSRSGRDRVQRRVSPAK
jgi:multidrug efflux system membrane fusion protein